MKTITSGEFHTIILEMAKVWPEIGNPARSKRYYNAISDLELDVVNNIAEVFLDTSTKMPLPVDFLNAAREFRKHYFEKTGQYYNKKDIPEPQSPHKLVCEYCYDTGFEWIEVDGVHAFCFCFCWIGDKAKINTKWMFPKSNEVEGMKRKMFPVKSFIPREVSDKNQLKEVFGVSKRFDLALQESQEFWNFKHKK